jgi:hypothetical protein
MMASRLRSVARLHAAERLAISLIRSASGTGDAIPESFLRLAKSASGSGRVILPMEARRLSDDEKILIGWITMFQRGRGSEIVREDAELAASLRECAQWLTAMGLHLPFYCTVRIPAFTGKLTIGHADSRFEGTTLSHASLKAMAADFARNRGVVSARDLKGIGVSRQYVSLLCKQGVLRRIGFAIYGPPAAP